MLFQTMTTNEAARQLMNDDNAAWSWEGALTIAEYLDVLHEDCGGDWEFNVVDVRCDFSEYTKEDLVSDYSCLLGRDIPSDREWAENCGEYMEELVSALNNETTVIELENGGYIVQQF